MCETSISERVRDFCVIARNASPNTPTAMDAQRFFKKHLMQVEDTRLLAQFPAIHSDERTALQQSFTNAVGKVVRALTGIDYQMDVGAARLIGHIPDTETGIRHTIHKVGLEMGMTSPR